MVRLASELGLGSQAHGLWGGPGFSTWVSGTGLRFSLFHGKTVALSHLPTGLPHLPFYFLKFCRNVFEEFICPSDQSLLEPVPIPG